MAPEPASRAQRLTRVRSKPASVVLIILGLVALLAGVLAIWAERTLVDSDTFSDRAVEALAKEEVRLVINDALVEQIEEGVDRELIAVRPILQAVVDGVIDSDVFREIARESVREIHASLLNREAGVLVLRLTDVFESVIVVLEAIDPELAAQIPDDLTDGVLEIRYASEDLADANEQIVETIDTVRWLPWLLPILAIAIIAMGIWLAPRRRSALIFTGLALVAAAVLLFAGREGLRELLVDAPGDADAANAVGATYDVFTRTLVTWLMALGAVGLVIAAAGSTAGRRVDVRSQLGGVWGLATRAPENQWGRLARGAALIILGVLVVLWIDIAVRILIVALALYVLYYGVSEFINLTGLVRGEADEESALEEDSEKHAATTGGRSVAGFALIAIAFAGIALVLTPWNWIGGGADGDAAGSISRLECNGHPELCQRRLDQVAFATTHNSMSAASEADWFLAAHSQGIKEQLEDGIRGFQIDTYYGVLQSDNTVYTLGKDDPGPELAEEFGEDLASAAGDIVDAVIPPADDDESKAEPFLCHAYCALGYTRFVDALTVMREFLDKNTGEVLIIFIEDEITGEDTGEAFEQSGLIKYVYTHPGGPFPTLREMIESDERVLVMSEKAGGSPDWYHPGFELTQETHFRAESPEEMNCAPNRGQTDSPLFQLNHFISPVSVSFAETVNEYDFFLNRALQCQEERGLMPNIVAVNYYRTGDLIDVVDALNGVGSRPEATPAGP